MDHYTLLQFGMRIVEARHDFQMKSLVKELTQVPESAEREILLKALKNKIQARAVPYPGDLKAKLYDLTRKWVRMDEPKKRGQMRRKYEEYLLGDMELAQVDKGKRAQTFNKALVAFCGSEDPAVLIPALFRVREAARQHLASKTGSDERETPMDEWSPDFPIFTIWGIPRPDAEEVNPAP